MSFRMSPKRVFISSINNICYNIILFESNYQITQKSLLNMMPAFTVTNSSVSSVSCCLRIHNRLSSSRQLIVKALSFQSAAKTGCGKFIGLELRASSYEVPIENVEDGKFVPLTAEDPRFGPPALLLLGFKLEEAPIIQQFLKDMEGDFLNIIYCTEDMINGTLWDAVNTQQEILQKSKVAVSLPRICFLSGLSGEEMIMFIDAFPETGLEPSVFAALVPNSANKSLRELIEEVMGDHEMLARKSESSADVLA